MIRPAEQKDIPRIAEILTFGKRVAYRDIFCDDDVSFNEIQVYSLIQEYTQDANSLDGVFVYDDGILKGMIKRTILEDSIMIRELYVEPFFQGEGIGRALLQSVLQEQSEKKIPTSILWVIEENLKARAFYEKNGFVNSGKVQLVEGTDKNEILYEFHL